MSSLYKHVFSIRYSHTFYEGRRYPAEDMPNPDLVFQPTRECCELLRRHRLLFRARPSSAVVIGEYREVEVGNASQIQPVVPIKAGTVFTFLVRLGDSRFLRITDLDQSKLKGSKVYLFKASVKAVAPPNGDVKLVDVDTATGLSKPLRAEPKVFKRSIERKPIYATVELVDADDDRVFAKAIPFEREPGNGDPGPFEATIDGTRLREGSYTVRILRHGGNPVETEPVFLTDDATVSQRFAFLQISFADDITVYNQPHVFKMNFQARSIRWIYDITVKVPTESDFHKPFDVEQLKLENTPAGRKFTSDVEPPPSDPKAPRKVTFSSDKLIELRHQPYRGIRLVESRGQAGIGGATTEELAAEGEESQPNNVNVIVENMPNPDDSRLVLGDDKKEFESRMSLVLK